MVVVFVALGVLVAWIDLQVVTLRRISLTRLVLLTSSIVAVPLVLRASDAGAFAVAAMEVLGLGVVAWTSSARAASQSAHARLATRSR